MATPTPMKHAPSQQGRTPSQLVAAATPPVSTPFSNPAHAAFSPRGPKSSPQQVKKSPATSVMLGQTSMGAFNFDSPSTAAAMGALGIGGGFDMGLDNVAVGGLDSLGAALGGEDDKLKRLDTILKLLSEKTGLVSEAGLERLAQRIGLELLSEEQTTPGGRKTRTLAIAGSAIALDIVLDNNIVQSTSLTYHGNASSVSRHMDAASRILLQDLQLLPHQSPLTKSLANFASNFERLAVLDKLSISPGLDCHEALAGIYASLERLHEWDLSKLRQDPAMATKPDDYLNAVAMCAQHGVPVMHARGKVGLALQYWKELRFVPPPSDTLAGFAEKHEKVWSMLVGCAPIENLGLPPVRVSENWISKNIVKDDASIGPGRIALDWQEPENVSLPQSDDNKDAGMDLLQPDLSTTRVPRVMFTVAFDPPVALPQNDWSRLYMYANVNPPNIELSHRGSPPTYDSLLFPIPSGVRVDPSEPRAISRERRVRVYTEDQKPVISQHHNTLFIYKPIYSQVVSEMAFSHPRQLVDMLPLLRQYAFLSTLLENSFGSKTSDSLSTTQTEDPSQGTKLHTPKSQTTTTKDQLAGFMGKAESGKRADMTSEQKTSMDVILWVHPLPHLQIVFPMGNATANITLKVLEGGTVEVVDDNILAQDEDGTNKGKKRAITKENLGRALEHMEDLCKWVEWIRTRLSE
ncbi:mediator of RNA polymerase II transcription subunit 1 domain-containing protein [Hirsutella rhossiliensis]|uniref:Mediator of RNA polymerase II transcription subunit 1 n=1 Tax=Hirsutella rhossiliensis TaxID=111463 RepID=A0A9P8MVI8_9HYPO|nr:mediator of RNA polymerase II transcription subunit 1 domain-containing protein [Hirsutella rhossiliensis]KAH0961944.1 mediator of RNA polymerase II transcription subunit 1 domain-containing protein [Hirsutella rhossiliensis]